MSGIRRNGGSADPPGGQEYGAWGYGQPPPGAQYGYPGPPPYPAPAARRSRFKLAWIIPVVVVVIVAAGVAVGLTVTKGGGNGANGSNGGRAVAAQGGAAAANLSAWQASQSQYDAMGTVTYGSELVVTADTGVYAYNRASGKLAWTVKAPVSGSAAGAFCGSGQHAVGGRLSVGFGVLTDPVHHILDCSSVGVVDLRSGKMLWTSKILTADLLNNDPIPVSGMLTEISGGTVMATLQGYAAAFSATTGHRLWASPYSSDFRDLAVAADGTFDALFVTLVPGPGEVPMALDGISPASGAVTSRIHLTAKMTKTGLPQEGAIVATGPVTLWVSDGGTGSVDQNASFVVLNPAGTRVVRVIPAGAQAPDAPPSSHVLFTVPLSGNADSHPFLSALVSGDTLIAVSYPSGAQPEYGLVAYDLSTGTRRWSATRPGVTMVTPVAVDGSTVVAVGSTLASGNETNPALVRVSLASGAVLSSTPRPTGQDAIGQSIGLYRFAWADGRAYGSDWDQTPIQAPTEFTMSASS
ncbi:MAG: PQQ-binding-like beta-propeller repeat protein [Trebonia sp.]